MPGLSEGEETVELPFVKPWKEWEQKKEPNRRMEREQAKLCKMMYMWGNKRVDEVVENKEESKAKNEIKEKKIGRRWSQI